MNNFAAKVYQEFVYHKFFQQKIHFFFILPVFFVILRY